MKRPRLAFLLCMLLFCAGLALVCVLFWPWIAQLKTQTGRDAFAAWIRNRGPLGVLTLAGVFALQIALAFVPGGPFELAAGAAYGALRGALICEAGCAIGSSAVFAFVRKCGIPLLRRLFGEKELSSWKFLQNHERAALAVFIIFLIPGMPKDMLTWFAPLSPLSLASFVVISLIARFPAIISTTIMADSGMKGNWALSLTIFAAVAVLGVLGIVLRDRIFTLLGKKG